ncbi:MAG: cyclic pyranopterin monophosphate synthase MoaC [Planctomycetota bacterium]
MENWRLKTATDGNGMKALCDVTVLFLTNYDILKYADRLMTITQIKLLEDIGGNSGDYKRQD